MHPSVEDALRPGAPLLHEAWGDNIANGLTHETGDVSGALAEAAVVLTGEFRIGRVTALPLEGRGVVAEYDRSTERLTVWYSSQAPHLFRTVLAGVLGFPEGRIHVISGGPTRGGSFSNLNEVYSPPAVRDDSQAPSRK